MIRSGWSVGRLRPAELMALAGVLALGVSLLFDWFKLLSLQDAVAQLDESDFEFLNRELGSAPHSSSRLDSLIPDTFWDLSVARWLIVIALVFGVAMLLANFLSTPGRSVILATPTFLFGTAATVALLYRALDAPRFVDHTSWLLVGLAGAAAIAFGGFWAMRDEYVPPGFKRGPEPELLKLSE